MERRYVNDFAEAEAVVEIEGIAAITATSAGSALILRVFRGNRRVGDVLEFPGPWPLTNCDFPLLRPHSRGILLLRRDHPNFPGFASDDELRFLRRHGLLPAD